MHLEALQETPWKKPCISKQNKPFIRLLSWLPYLREKKKKHFWTRLLVFIFRAKESKWISLTLTESKDFSGQECYTHMVPWRSPTLSKTVKKPQSLYASLSLPAGHLSYRLMNKIYLPSTYYLLGIVLGAWYIQHWKQIN